MSVAAEVARLAARLAATPMTDPNRRPLWTAYADLLDLHMLLSGGHAERVLWATPADPEV